MVTHYQGSKGPKPIASMVTQHLFNALSKLERDEPHRADEITAMRAEFEGRPDKDDVK